MTLEGCGKQLFGTHVRTMNFNIGHGTAGMPRRFNDKRREREVKHWKDRLETDKDNVCVYRLINTDLGTRSSQCIAWEWPIPVGA